MAAKRVLLIHWNAEEAKSRATQLRKMGYRVEHSLPHVMEQLRKMADDPPAAVVVDLSRMPSQGRDVALAIRQRKSTRGVPLIFTEGETEKVERIRKVLPDACFTRWSAMVRDLPKAIASPPEAPRVPVSILEGYSGTPLPKKLGIKPGMTVLLVGAPPDFATTLGTLPEGAALSVDARSRSGLSLWFLRSRKELAAQIKKMTARGAEGPVWMIWPKKTSSLASDLGERDVREVGLAAGLVDYKVCAVDSTWSGLLFALRKKK